MSESVRWTLAALAAAGLLIGALPLLWVLRRVGGDILRFKPYLTVLGLETVYKITRVEGRWLKADDANTHKGTAFDRGGGTGPGWLQLYKNGTSGPFRWMVAGAHGQAVSQLPD